MRIIDYNSNAPLLVIPAMVVVICCMFLPLVLLFRFSLNHFSATEFMIEAITLENYILFFTDPYYLETLKTTVFIAVVVTGLCFLLGYPIAHGLAHTSSSHKGRLILAIVMPLFVGNAVRAAGWMMIFGKQGLINSAATGLSLSGAPWDLMYTPGAVIVGIAAINLSFVVLTIQSVIEGIDRQSEEAAASLGAAPFTVWRKVTLPLALPGILTAGIISFILSMNAYATPVLLGGPLFRMMAPVIADEILEKSNIPFGAALAFILMTVTLLLTVGVTFWFARRRQLQI